MVSNWSPQFRERDGGLATTTCFPQSGSEPESNWTRIRSHYSAPKNDLAALMSHPIPPPTRKYDTTLSRSQGRFFDGPNISSKAGGGPSSLPQQAERMATRLEVPIRVSTIYPLSPSPNRSLAVSPAPRSQTRQQPSSPTRNKDAVEANELDNSLLQHEADLKAMVKNYMADLEISLRSAADTLNAAYHREDRHVSGHSSHDTSPRSTSINRSGASTANVARYQKSHSSAKHSARSTRGRSTTPGSAAAHNRAWR
ncbi:hypothetical protein DFJ77DRAFT_66082 [Powellomyces hirtus]|nr:hypothetical protein DFJ77DRAFT_66082 [Powellomyces hirtus]